MSKHRKYSIVIITEYGDQATYIDESGSVAICDTRDLEKVLNQHMLYNDGVDENGLTKIAKSYYNDAHTFANQLEAFKYIYQEIDGELKGFDYFRIECNQDNSRLYLTFEHETV